MNKQTNQQTNKQPKNVQYSWLVSTYYDSYESHGPSFHDSSRVAHFIRDTWKFSRGPLKQTTMVSRDPGVNSIVHFHMCILQVVPFLKYRLLYSEFTKVFKDDMKFPSVCIGAMACVFECVSKSVELIPTLNIRAVTIANPDAGLFC